MESPVSWASCFFWSSEGYGCVKCWNSQARKIFVATLGKIPRFLEFLDFPVGSSSSSPEPSQDPTLALEASPASLRSSLPCGIKRRGVPLSEFWPGEHDSRERGPGS